VRALPTPNNAPAVITNLLAQVVLCARRDVRSASFLLDCASLPSSDGRKDALRTSLRAHRTTCAKGLLIPLAFNSYN